MYLGTLEIGFIDTLIWDSSRKERAAVQMPSEHHNSKDGMLKEGEEGGGSMA